MLIDTMRKKDIATIANRLQVPLVIADILNDEASLTDDVKYGLHEILSNDQPDSALLSIALSAHAIASDENNEGAIFDSLRIDCERVISEYGMMWLRNAQSERLDNNAIFETLVHIPEDLEIIGELLGLTRINLEFTNSDAAQLCKILQVQAGAQSLIAQAFLDSMDIGGEEPWKIYQDEDMDMNTILAAESTSQPFYTDNIIPFPATAAMARN